LRGEGGGGLLDLVEMVVLVPHKDIECKVEKLTSTRSWRPCRLKTNPTFQHVNKQSRISPNEAFTERGGLITFFR